MNKFNLYVVGKSLIRNNFVRYISLLLLCIYRFLYIEFGLLIKSRERIIITIIIGKIKMVIMD